MQKRKVINLLLAAAIIGILGVLALFVRVGSTADYVAVLKTQGMTCSACAGRIEKTLKAKPGVTSVEVDLDGGRVIVGYDSKLATPELVAESVSAIGYGSSVLEALTAQDYRKATGKEIPLKKTKAGCACCNKNN